MKYNKKIFLEYILILLSVLTLCTTLVCKKIADKKSSALDTVFEQLFIASSEQLNLQEENAALKQLLTPYLLFDENLAALFSAWETSMDHFNLHQLHIATLSRNRIIASGFSRLEIFSLLMLVIAVILIIYRQGEENVRLQKQLTFHSEHEKIGKNLHDGVSKDIAHAQECLEKGDSENASLAIKRAFNEVSYLIDSMHLQLSTPLTTLMTENLEAFQAHYAVNTSLHITSTKLKTISAETQLEFFYILQEALHLIAHRAEATEVSVKLYDVEDAVVFTIHDNGSNKRVNFAPLRERVTQFGGLLEVFQTAGTTVVIKLSTD